MNKRPEKRNNPTFMRRNYSSMKRLAKVWRRPKGMQNKLRHKFKGYGSVVSVGYRNPEVLRGRHNSGKEFVMVENQAIIASLDAAKHIAILSSNTGKKKRMTLLEVLKTKSIEVHNIQDIDKYMTQVKEGFAARKKKVEEKKKEVKEEKKEPVKTEEKKKLTEEEKKKEEKAEKDKILTKRK